MRALLLIVTLLLSGCLGEECVTLGHRAEIAVEGDDAIDRIEAALVAEGWNVTRRTETTVEATRGDGWAHASPAEPGSATTLLTLRDSPPTEEGARTLADPLAARLDAQTRVAEDRHCGQV